MALVSLRCQHCGAPLPSAHPGASLTCSYCGTNYVVPGAPPAPKPLVPALPLPSAPAPRKSSATGVIVGLALAVLVAAAAGYYFLVRQGPSLFKEWYSAGCLVDANGDQTLDVAGFTGTPGNTSFALAVVDGNTGGSLFTGARHAPTAGLICASPTHFGVDDTNFELALYPSRQRERLLTLKLTDHLTGLGVGAGCFALETGDERLVSVSDRGTPVSSCQVERIRQPLRFTTLHARDSVELRSGSIQYTLSASKAGTPFLEAAARSGERELWRTRLRYVRASGGLALLVTPKALSVYASDPRDSAYGVLVGIDPATGAELYAKPQGSSWSGNIGSFEFNGRFVIAAWGAGLHAYEPATGERVWHIGGR